MKRIKMTMEQQQHHHSYVKVHQHTPRVIGNADLEDLMRADGIQSVAIGGISPEGLERLEAGRIKIRNVYHVHMI